MERRLGARSAGVDGGAAAVDNVVMEGILVVTTQGAVALEQTGRVCVVVAEQQDRCALTVNTVDAQLRVVRFDETVAGGQHWSVAVGLPRPGVAEPDI